MIDFEGSSEPVDTATDRTSGLVVSDPLRTDWFAARSAVVRRLSVGGLGLCPGTAVPIRTYQ